MRTFEHDLEIGRELQNYRDFSKKEKELAKPSVDDLANRIVQQLADNNGVVVDAELHQTIRDILSAEESVRKEMDVERKEFKEAKEMSQNRINDKIREMLGPVKDNENFQDEIKLNGIGNIKWQTERKTYIDWDSLDKAEMVQAIIDMGLENELLQINEDAYLNFDKSFVEEHGTHLSGVKESFNIKTSIRTAK